ncbi:LacI family DNA-binding transcriptional regulator [Microbacterium sp. A82]|uniref:LacI family DNA-binding transcriptional regulator n=1 Tax=Microbacterium sp. A82 TaxID=3450452 RepID=UPI003F2ED020
MARPATSIDVARRAGVSQATVSRALRDLPSITPETKERVYRAARELNYVPREAGRSLSTRRSRRIAIVAEALTNPYYPELIEPLRRELAQLGYRAVLLADSSDDVLTADALSDGSYDGVLVTTAARDTRLAEDLRERGVPHVFVNRTVDDQASRSCGFADGAHLLADLLVEQGHERIALLTGPTQFSTAFERERGLRSALREHGLRIRDTQVLRVDYTDAAGQRACRRLLEAAEPPTAIVCGNDVVAIGALNAAHALGWRVPEDVSIVGFDDIPAAGWNIVSLTTVHCDLNALAATSVTALREAMAGSARAHRDVLDVSLVLRTSHGPPRDVHTDTEHRTTLSRQ